MSDDYKRWWYDTATNGHRGIIDTILRLLETEEITRSKAREVLERIARVPRTVGTWGPAEELPLDRLEWAEHPTDLRAPRIAELERELAARPVQCRECGGLAWPHDNGIVWCDHGHS